MRLINQTKNTVLAENVLIADTPLKRIRGLLGKDAILPGQGVILAPCNSVHTFFMRFAIDVLFVDKDYKVVKIIPELKPNRVTRIYWQSKRVIELPAGQLSFTGTQVQDQLQLSV
jgi:uncharacterized membrane protein (UPF0127 family)